MTSMNPIQNYPLSRRMLLTATFIGMLAFSSAANAQPGSAKSDSGKPLSVLPLEESASRGIYARDPSSIVKCKDEFWVFYTARGVPSYRSKELVGWDGGPAVCKP